MPEEYMVQPGDCLISIAHAHGFTPDTLWNAPENEELRNANPDAVPEILKPGDIIHIPDRRERHESGAVERRHRFQRGAPAYLRLRFLNAGEPRAGVSYLLSIGLERREGTTDADGCLEEKIPPDVMFAQLRLGPPESAEDYCLKIGELDPLPETSGAQARLKNLGFYAGQVDNIFGNLTRAALSAFQKECEIEQTCRIDDPTKAKLRSEYKC